MDHPDLAGVGDHQGEAQQDEGHVDTKQRLLGAVPLLAEDIHRHSGQTEVEEPWQLSHEMISLPHGELEGGRNWLSPFEVTELG